MVSAKSVFFVHFAGQKVPFGCIFERRDFGEYEAAAR
jgi:hypothetical protein